MRESSSNINDRSEQREMQIRDGMRNLSLAIDIREAKRNEAEQ